MSQSLAPSRSTVYVSNLPYELKNNDIHKVFEKHGRIIKVTIIKDKENRRSKGVAFILFLNRDDAKTCVEATNMKEMFGRTLKASIAKDNGRSTEFIRRKNYPDKSSCFECGEEGHLSYKCEKNLLGERKPPPKKVRKRKKETESVKDEPGDSSEEEYKKLKEDEGETLSAVIAMEQEKREFEALQNKNAEENCADTSENSKKRKIRKSSYFSDEEEFD